MSKLDPAIFTSVAVRVSDSGVEKVGARWRPWTMTEILSKTTGEVLSTRRYEGPAVATEAEAVIGCRHMLDYLHEVLVTAGVEIAPMIEEGGHR